MPDSEAKKAWVKAHTDYFGTRLNHNTDADIIEHLSKISNRQGYIKKLIRDDIARQKTE